jgi:hypothetical protein
VEIFLRENNFTRLAKDPPDEYQKVIRHFKNSTINLKTKHEIYNANKTPSSLFGSAT